MGLNYIYMSTNIPNIPYGTVLKINDRILLIDFQNNVKKKFKCLNGTTNNYDGKQKKPIIEQFQYCCLAIYSRRFFLLALYKHGSCFKTVTISSFS